MGILQKKNQHNAFVAEVIGLVISVRVRFCALCVMSKLEVVGLVNTLMVIYTAYIVIINEGAIT
mgnify:CR=1 FL=1